MVGETHFIDSSFVYALFSERDTYHNLVVQLSRTFTEQDRFVITDAVLLECGSLLAAPKLRPAIAKSAS